MKEIQIQKAIKDYLQILENQGKLMFLRNQAGGYATKEGHYIKMGKKGSPDLLVWVKSGKSIPVSVISPDTDWIEIENLRAIALEVKSATGTQSKDQKEWQDKFEKLGGEYYIVRSVDEVIDIMKGEINEGK